MIRLAVAGASGRMGQRILNLADEDDRFTIAAALTEEPDPRLGQVLEFGEDRVALSSALDADCDVYVDRHFML